MKTLDALALLDLGDSIRERRTEIGWSQAELSRHADVPQADISRIENGLLDPRWSTIQRLLAALASSDAEPRRSLANGGRVSTIPSRPAKKWAPKGPTLEIRRDPS